VRRNLYLLSDSALLFLKGGDGQTLVERIVASLGHDDVAAAYIGASSGDKPEYAEIFEAAVSDPRIKARRAISSRYSAMDNMCLMAAELIVLGGGDAARGWTVMCATGMRDVILQRYFAGAILVGVSAGAMQLGRGIADDRGSLVDTFRFAPWVVAAHDEANEWRNLEELLKEAEPGTRGLGIPHGGGASYHPDDGLTPLRRPLTEIELREGEAARSLLLPDAGE
jgi:hypothetical protein